MRLHPVRKIHLFFILSGLALMLVVGSAIKLSFFQAEGDSLPKSYDLRDHQAVTSPKKQAWGTCWIFASFSSLESSLLKNGQWEKAGEKGEPDLAEYHFDKFNAFHRRGDKRHVKDGWYSGQGERFPGGNTDDPESGVVVHLGGDYRMAAAILSNGKGAVQERLTPTIPPEGDHQRFGDLPSEGVLKENNYTYFVPRHVEWITFSGDKKEVRRKIKKSIMTYGAVASAQHMKDEPQGTFQGTEVHGFTGEKDPSHAISLIGWNDSFEFNGHRGAWLVKDSDHKDESGNHVGVFWVLYDDVHVGGHKEMGGIRFRGVAQRPYENIYTHALHGWRYSTKGDPKVKKAGNLFNAKREEVLTEVGFYTVAENTNWRIEVWDERPKAFSSNSVPLTSLSGEFRYPGFHRVRLPREIRRERGEDFFVTLEVDKGGYAYDASFDLKVLLGTPLPEWGEPVAVHSKASPGESFYLSAKGEWEDFSSYVSPVNEQKDHPHASKARTANFALNVYSNSRD